MGLRAALILVGVSALSASVAPTIAEANGIVASEVERAAAHGGWQSRTDIAGYSGSAFYYMDGATAYQSPGNDLLEYPFVISTGGIYQFQLRGRIAFGTDSTEHNDSFVRLVEGSGTAMAPIANDNTATGTQWFKVYQSQLNTWVWNSANRDHDPKSLAWDLTPGTYRLQISKRSQGHAIDRWVLWNRALHNLADTSTGTSANDTALNALTNSQETGTPPANQAPQVHAGPNRTVIMPNAATLSGTASDDGLPAGSTLSVTWTKHSGPGTVTFAQANVAATTATFSAAGAYVLRLTASDGALSAHDDMTVNVQTATDGGTPGAGGTQGNDGNRSNECGFGAVLALILVFVLGLHRGLPGGSTLQGADSRAKTSPR